MNWVIDNKGHYILVDAKGTQQGRVYPDAMGTGPQWRWQLIPPGYGTWTVQWPALPTVDEAKACAIAALVVQKLEE